MTSKILGLAAGAALLALQPLQASAHTDVYVGLDFGIAAPVVVERYPAYYDYEPAPVYYYRDYERPRYVVREYDRHDERRWHKHHKRHKRHRHHGH